MKKLLFISLFLVSVTSLSQSTNEPQTVFPMVEQFIAEAHAAGVPTYHKIREIDSIAIASLPYPLSGLHLKGTTYESITIHRDSVRSARRIEKTFYHEVGHVLGLKHTSEPRKIMNSDSYDLWFENDNNWRKAKEEYFKQLSKP